MLEIVGNRLQTARTEHSFLSVDIATSYFRTIIDTVLPCFNRPAYDCLRDVVEAVPHLGHVVQLFSRQASMIALPEMVWRVQKHPTIQKESLIEMVPVQVSWCARTPPRSQSIWATRSSS